MVFTGLGDVEQTARSNVMGSVKQPIRSRRVSAGIEWAGGTSEDGKIFLRRFYLRRDHVSDDLSLQVGKVE
jgi:hypothetical protein